MISFDILFLLNNFFTKLCFKYKIKSIRVVDTMDGLKFYAALTEKKKKIFYYKSLEISKSKIVRTIRILLLHGNSINKVTKQANGRKRDVL